MYSLLSQRGREGSLLSRGGGGGYLTESEGG